VFLLLVCLVFVLFDFVYFYFFIEPIPTISSNQKPDVNERPRPKGNNSDAFNRTTSMRSSDINQTTTNVFKRQSSLTLGDLPSIAEMKYKNSLTDTSNRFCL
jgi:hypothetical protein